MTDLVEGIRSGPGDAAPPAPGKVSNLTGVYQAIWRRGLSTLGGATVLAVAAAVIVPVVILVILSFKSTTRLDQSGVTTGNYTALFATPGEWTTIRNTVVFVAGGALVAVVLGTTLAYAVTSVNVPGRSVLRVVPMLALILPPLVKDPAWIIVFGPGKTGLANIVLTHLIGVHPLFNIFSLPGMIAVAGCFASPIVYIVMLAPFEGIDKSYTEASTASGASHLRTFTRTTLPMLRPALLSGVVLVVMIVASSFETPVLIGLPAGVNTYMNQIYELVNSVVPSLNTAAAQGTIYVALTMCMILFYLRATANERRFVAIVGRGHEHVVTSRRVLRWVLLGFFLLYAILVVVGPFAIIILVSLLSYYTVVNGNPFHNFTITNFHQVFVDTQLRDSVISSTELAACCAVAAVIIALLLAWISLKSRKRLRYFAEFIAMAPIAIPPMVLSFGLLLTVLSIPGLAPVLYGTPFLMFLADLIVFLPISMRLVSSALVQVHDELIEAGRISGASSWGVVRSVVLPIIRPALFYTVAIVFVVSYRELAAIVLIPAQNTQLVPYASFTAWQKGGIVELAALNVITLVVPLVIIGVAFLLAGAGRLGGRRRSTASRVRGSVMASAIH